MHTKLVSLFIALFLCLPLFAQKESVPRIDSEGVYLIPDEMPKFPGGMQAMMKYLATNVKYPVEAQKKGVSGRVIIQFVVMEDGTPGPVSYTISEPTRQAEISYAVFCLKKKKTTTIHDKQRAIKNE